jgi:hypothetical protein
MRQFAAAVRWFVGRAVVCWAGGGLLAARWTVGRVVVCWPRGEVRRDRAVLWWPRGVHWASAADKLPRGGRRGCDLTMPTFARAHCRQSAAWMDVSGRRHAQTALTPLARVELTQMVLFGHADGRYVSSRLALCPVMGAAPNPLDANRPVFVTRRAISVNSISSLPSRNRWPHNQVRRRMWRRRSSHQPAIHAALH